ncbi:HepT-like ribonuclease domain-containing protein [Laspinema olomoucense]|uniref:DUF86 domain-containing protein n=1 Tax=Laspinema olomoucense D3b TaxID=2953688 RepID=A0ABT2N7X4_9CYAN|nr:MULTISPECIES: HepT-like ribonuclease domain-containing protein [unclassified Laspinema]MCT7978790.1 DUF86 domain-containing protein [Laspinema sp. D3b]MCT7989470.1 DUF86 domain-containing protein [Laspinema sp. D3a]
MKDYTSTGKDSFYEQMLIQDAVLRNLEVMCESIKKLPDEWKASEHNIPWHKIVGFRNKLAHQYLNVDLDVVWDIVENYLPELEISIEKIAKRFLG